MRKSLIGKLKCEIPGKVRRAKKDVVVIDVEMDGMHMPSDS